MADESFYRNFGPFSLKEISLEANCELHGDKNFFVNDLAPLNLANETDLTFFSNKRYLSDFKKTKAGVCIVEKTFKKYNSNIKNFLISNNPYYVFSIIAKKFYPDSIYPNYYFSDMDAKENLPSSVKISSNSFIHKTAKIGKNVVVGINSIIGPSVNIGDNCIIGDNVSIYFSIIKDNVKIFSGTKIGSEGFGFAIDGNNFHKIPQIGRVIIFENVEIGSNCTIDRGSSGDTIIGKNCMIDNLVHIAHNVEIGDNSIIAGQTGISGSSSLGKGNIVGGQVGVSGHLKIGNNVKIAAKSGIMKDIDDNDIIGGYPGYKIRDWHKTTLFLKKSIKRK